MNKILLISDIDHLASKKLEYAKEELENNGIEWNDNYLNAKDFSPEFEDFGSSLDFNFYLGGYTALMKLKEKL